MNVIMLLQLELSYFKAKSNQVAARIAKIKAQNQATSLINKTTITQRRF